MTATTARSVPRAAASAASSRCCAIKVSVFGYATLSSNQGPSSTILIARSSDFGRAAAARQMDVERDWVGDRDLAEHARPRIRAKCAIAGLPTSRDSAIISPQSPRAS